MIYSINYKTAIGCVLMLFLTSLKAQDAKSSTSNYDIETLKRAEHYEELSKLGYKDKEIFEDLGNANFLLENYETAVYWYQKLIDMDTKGAVPKGYYERYEHAMAFNSGDGTKPSKESKDWLASVKDDYKVKTKIAQPSLTESLANNYNYATRNSNKALEELVSKENELAREDDNTYASTAPVALTADGNTAYFSKAVYVKPMYGVFSKKELVHKIYRADRIKGEWTNLQEVAVAPKNSNAIHPALSKDGKRLFFASDMPGTFGEYDIYVADINKDGTYGVSKNLGENVNTAQNDLFPNITEENSLYYASNGRDGFGGLDIYVAQVNHKKVSKSVHLESPINSSEDDYSIFLMSDKGMGYVMSNRGNDKDLHQPIAFAYSSPKAEQVVEEKVYHTLEAFNPDSNSGYTNTVFEE